MPNAPTTPAAEPATEQPAAKPKRKRSKASTSKAKTSKATTAKASKASKASKAKPKAKPAAEPRKPREKGSGTTRHRDVKWTDKKVAIYKALKQLKATNASSAQAAKAVAEKASTAKLKITTADVRHYCYAGQVPGYTLVTQVEGVRGYGFALTAKGAKLDPAAELKKAQASD